MHRQARLPGCLGDLGKLADRPDAPAAAIVRVLDADKACPREVQVRRHERRPQVVGSENPAPRPHQPARNARQRSRATAFVIVDVRVLAHHHLVARLGVTPQRHLVGHRTGGHVQRRGHGENLRRLPLELGNRRVLFENIVTDRRLGHRAPHLGRRLGYRVAAKVNESRHRASFQGQNNSV